MSAPADNAIDPQLPADANLFHRHLRETYDRVSKEAPKDPTLDKDSGIMVGTTQIQLLDKLYTTLRFDEIEVDVWEEDGRDIYLQVFPCDKQWQNFDFAMREANDQFAQVFGPLEKRGVRCEAQVFSWRTGDAMEIKRATRPDVRHPEMLAVRICGVLTAPGAIDRTVHVLKNFNDVLAGRTRPVRGDA